MKIVPWGLLSALLAISFTASALVGNPEAGKKLSTQCVTCHNLDGNSTTPIWPNLASQHETYLYKQLLEFRKGADGQRNQPVMTAIIGQMSDQNFADLAAYFTAQKLKPLMADPSQVALGEKIYRGGNLNSGVSACSACHGPAGLGNEAAGFPRLSGQHAAYLVDQLQKFRDGTRKNDPGAMMQDIAKRMTDAEMQAVAAFLQGLQPK